MNDLNVIQISSYLHFKRLLKLSFITFVAQNCLPVYPCLRYISDLRRADLAMALDDRCSRHGAYRVTLTKNTKQK